VRERTKDRSAGGPLSFIGFIWLLIHGGMLNAAVMDVTGFTQITGAGFYDAPASNVLTSVTIGTVVIKPDVSMLNESFAGAMAPQYGPDVPGDGSGFGSDSQGFDGATSLMLDFSQPVAAFGATFVHLETVQDDTSFASPVSIQLFSGLDGTGTLVGSVTDATEGVVMQGPAVADFRGLWSDEAQIRSVEISSTYPKGGGFQVDGFAVSLTPMPIPEPLTLVPVGTGLIGLGIVLRRAKK
jgi:hypothetical protein